MGRTVQLMAQHIAQEAQIESRDRQRMKAGKPGPHHIAVATLEATVAGISNYAIASNFNLSEDLEAAVELGRYSIHESSRKVRMTDEELGALCLSALKEIGRLFAGGADMSEVGVAGIFAAMKDLRDRYEGLGKYAPVPPAPAAAPAPALVKP